ncbi:YdcF family protein [Heliobacillus mobilis]|uniref:YdcF family protein n=1 Tax=Heliobacterium mobile TaxID=28064 RepID=A0A6I3SIU2_HELMO|nr:YdcF family protein [Heliobacterium mobile]MTV48788.1 YdcF family protein [Heliobacterium mobile]
MLFLIKFLYSFLLPPGLFVVILLFISAWNFYRRKKSSAYISIWLAFLIYALSMPIIGDLFIRSLESRFTPPASVNGDVIVLLGGGATSDTPDVDGVGQLTGSSANRMLTAARLHRQTGLPIILSAGQVYNDTGNESLIAQRQLITLGIPEDKLIVEGNSRNTEENARFTKSLLDEKGFSRPLLVTSAFHMERAVLNFEKVGITVQPYPTDYKTNAGSIFYLNKLAPSADTLSNVSLASKEYLGILAINLGL